MLTSRTIRTVTSFAALLPIAIVGGFSPAHANVTFCNRTNDKVDVAFAWVEKEPPDTTTNGHRGVRAQGWWTLDPRQCREVSKIVARDNEMWFFARSIAGGAWDASSWLCVTQQKFVIGQSFRRKEDTCGGDQYLVGFRGFGSSAANHTENLNR